MCNDYVNLIDVSFNSMFWMSELRLLGSIEYVEKFDEVFCFYLMGENDVLLVMIIVVISW